MPKLEIAEEFTLHTRDRYTSVECTLSIKIDGKELPSSAYVGEALEKLVTLLQTSISESYVKIPERI